GDDAGKGDRLYRGRRAGRGDAAFHAAAQAAARPPRPQARPARRGGGGVEVERRSTPSPAPRERVASGSEPGEGGAVPKPSPSRPSGSGPSLSHGAGEGPSGWLRSLATYTEPRLIAVLFMGFSSGLPLALTTGTLQVWQTRAGVSLATIGFFA